jgi:hypothetical protein
VAETLFILIFANILGPICPRKREERSIKEAADNSLERRKIIRYRMRAQVIFHWSRSRKERFQGEGTTRDVSLGGAYILTTTCPPVSTTVQMEIIFPPLHSVSSTRIRAKMKVLRVEPAIAGERRGGFSVIGKAFSVRAITKNSDPTAHSVNGHEGKR